MKYIIYFFAFIALVAYYGKEYIYVLGDTATVIATVFIAIALCVFALYAFVEAMKTEC